LNDEPIQVPSFTQTSFGFVSAVDVGNISFDNLFIRQLPSPNVISSHTKTQVQNLFQSVQERLPKGLSQSIISFFNRLPSASHYDTDRQQIRVSSKMTYRLVHLLHILSGLPTPSIETFIQDELLHELSHAVLDQVQVREEPFNFLLEDSKFKNQFVKAFGIQNWNLDEILAKAVSAINSDADLDAFGENRTEAVANLKSIADELGKISHEGKSLRDWLILPNISFENESVVRRVKPEQRSILENNLRSLYPGEIVYPDRDDQFEESLQILQALAASQDQLRTVFKDDAKDVSEHIIRALSELGKISEEIAPYSRTTDTSA
jgi:hypothetical protein